MNHGSTVLYPVKSPRPASRPFGVGVFAQRAERLPVGPSREDHAFDLGYRLGMDGNEAVSNLRYCETLDEWDAFFAGLDLGLAKFNAHIEAEAEYALCHGFA